VFVIWDTIGFDLDLTLQQCGKHFKLLQNHIEIACTEIDFFEQKMASLASHIKGKALIYRLGLGQIIPKIDRDKQDILVYEPSDFISTWVSAELNMHIPRCHDLGDDETFDVIYTRRHHMSEQEAEWLKGKLNKGGVLVASLTHGLDIECTKIRMEIKSHLNYSDAYQQVICVSSNP
jgi:hypothetical protein